MEASRDSIVRSLNEVYATNRIAFANFGCPHRATCESDAGGRPLVKGIEAHVGTKYGETDRIVVVSLDSGGDSDDIDGRTATIEAVAEQGANSHMYGTYRFLRSLLTPQIGEASPLPYFAMLNSAKCSASDKSMDMVPYPIHVRCHGYVLQELTALQPELVWLQSRNLANVFYTRLAPLPDLHSRVAAALMTKGVNDDRATQWAVNVAEEHLRLLKGLTDTYLTVVTVHPSERYGRWAYFERTLMAMVAEIAMALVASRRTSGDP